MRAERDTKADPLAHSDKRQELLMYMLLIVLVFVFGTLGYVAIEGWSVFDAFYMTTITLATIGYGETHALSTAGRAFTIALIFLGVGIGTVVVGAATKIVIERQFSRMFNRRRRMAEKIDGLSGHTIFCGFSRLGGLAAEELRKAGATVVVIETNAVRADEAERLGFYVVRGDATLDESLTKAGVARAARLVSLLPRDSDNLYVILMAREINPSLYIVSRAEDDVGETRLKRAGVDKLISTYRLAARKLSDALVRPYVTDFFEAGGAGNEGWRIEEIRIPPSSPICGQSLKDLSLRQKTQVGIAAVISPTGDLEVNPGGSTVVSAGATLIAIGWKRDIEKLEHMVLG